MAKLTIATRVSDLALWQAYHIKDRIEATYPEIEVELNKIKGITPFSFVHGESTIKKLNSPEILSFLFGPMFSSVKKNYFCWYVECEVFHSRVYLSCL